MISPRPLLLCLLFSLWAAHAQTFELKTVQTVPQNVNDVHINARHQLVLESPWYSNNTDTTDPRQIVVEVKPESKRGKEVQVLATADRPEGTVFTTLWTGTPTPAVFSMANGHLTFSNGQTTVVAQNRTDLESIEAELASNGTVVAIRTYFPQDREDDDKIFVYRLPDLTLMRTLKVPEPFQETNVDVDLYGVKRETWFTLSSSGKFMAVYGRPGIVVYDLSSGQEVAHFTEQGATSVTLNENQEAYFVGRDESVYQWNFRSGQVQHISQQAQHVVYEGQSDTLFVLGEGSSNSSLVAVFKRAPQTSAPQPGVLRRYTLKGKNWRDVVPLEDALPLLHRSGIAYDSKNKRFYAAFMSDDLSLEALSGISAHPGIFLDIKSLTSYVRFPIEGPEAKEAPYHWKDTGITLFTQSSLQEEFFDCQDLLKVKGIAYLKSTCLVQLLELTSELQNYTTTLVQDASGVTVRGFVPGKQKPILPFQVVDGSIPFLSAEKSYWVSFPAVVKSDWKLQLSGNTFTASGPTGSIEMKVKVRSYDGYDLLKKQFQQEVQQQAAQLKKAEAEAKKNAFPHTDQNLKFLIQKTWGNKTTVLESVQHRPSGSENAGPRQLLLYSPEKNKAIVLLVTPAEIWGCTIEMGKNDRVTRHEILTTPQTFRNKEGMQFAALPTFVFVEVKNPSTQKARYRGYVLDEMQRMHQVADGKTMKNTEVGCYITNVHGL